MGPRRRNLGCALLLTGLSLACGTGPSPDRVSVLLITLDTTRADHLGCYGARWAATPHLDRLASEGVVFERATTSAPLTTDCTAPSMVTVSTGGISNTGKEGT